MFSSNRSDTSSRYDLNKLKTCKFFLSGKCTAGANCPFPHIHNRGNDDVNDDDLSSQSHSRRNSPAAPTFDFLSSKESSLSLADAILLPSALFEELGFTRTTEKNNYSNIRTTNNIIKEDEYKDIKLCPFHIIGKCKFGQDGCRMVHGKKCIYCQKNAIDIRYPNDHLSKCKFAPNYQPVEGDGDGESRIDCRHWNGREGSCPFGQSCYYNHGSDCSSSSDGDGDCYRIGGSGLSGPCGDDEQPRTLRLCDFLFK